MRGRFQLKIDAYRKDRDHACLTAAANLRGLVGEDLRISEISGKALDAVSSQWKISKFDWAVVYDTHKKPNDFKFAIWKGETLCALALARLTTKSVHLSFLEGSPHSDCPLRGKRVLIALETASIYGQRRGKQYLTLEPLNEKLSSVYQGTFGFSAHQTPSGTTFCSKEI